MNFYPFYLTRCQTRKYHGEKKGGEKVKGRPRLIVRMDSYAISELRMQAHAQGMSLSEYVREILYAYLDMHS